MPGHSVEHAADTLKGRQLRGTDLVDQGFFRCAAVILEKPPIEGVRVGVAADLDLGEGIDFFRGVAA